MTVHPDTTSPAPSPPAKKPRNPVELFVVRGGIALLVVLAAVQAHARFGYQMSLQKLQQRLSTEEETALPLLMKDVPGLISGFPSRSRKEDRHWHQVTYKWRGITQSYEIRMQYDSSEEAPAVLALETADAPPPAPLNMPDENMPAEAAPQVDYAAMAGRGGPGMGGGPRPDPMANDKDGDGKLSKEEAPQRMAANFEQWDTNTDGFVDKEEVAAGVAQFAGRRGGPGGGRPPGEEGSRPQRPAAESTPAATEAAPPEEAPADAAKVNP